MTEALAQFLNHPKICPHGNPIPGPDGFIEESKAVPLNKLSIGETGMIARVDRPETALCEYLAEREVLPGISLCVQDIAPYNGPYLVSIKDREIALGREIAARIYIELDE